MFIGLVFLSAVLGGCSVSTLHPGAVRGFTGMGAPYLYVLATDYTVGAVYRVDLVRGDVAPTVLPAGPDASLRLDPFGSGLWVVNGLGGDHLTQATRGLKLLTQRPLPGGSNPQDVAFFGQGQAYVSLYEGTHLWRLNSEQFISAVDLAPWVPADSLAGAVSLHWDGEQVWVALQRLNRQYQPQFESLVLAVDPRTDRVIEHKTLRLQSKNPMTEFRPWAVASPSAPLLCIGSAGEVGRSPAQLDGGIECFDPKTGQSVGEVISERALNGDIVDFLMLGATHAVAIVANGSQTWVVGFDPSAGTTTGVWAKSESYIFSHLALDPVRRLIFVTDRTLERPGVRIFGWDGEPREKNRIELELPPFKIRLAD